MRPAAGHQFVRPLGAVRRTDFAKALKAAGVTYSINNALNDPQKQKAQAAACLAAGAKVVIETSLDPGSAVAIEKSFTSKGGYAIDYDRQVVGGIASAYITFDGNKVGRAQATGVSGRAQGQDEAGRRRALGRPDGSRTRSGSRAETTTS